MLMKQRNEQIDLDECHLPKSLADFVSLHSVFESGGLD